MGATQKLLAKGIKPQATTEMVTCTSTQFSVIIVSCNITFALSRWRRLHLIVWFLRHHGKAPYWHSHKSSNAAKRQRLWSANSFSLRRLMEPMLRLPYGEEYFSACTLGMSFRLIGWIIAETAHTSSSKVSLWELCLVHAPLAAYQSFFTRLYECFLMSFHHLSQFGIEEQWLFYCSKYMVFP